MYPKGFATLAKTVEMKTDEKVEIGGRSVGEAADGNPTGGRKIEALDLTRASGPVTLGVKHFKWVLRRSSRSGPDC